MKGIILYSSNTGNTKKLAEKIYEYMQSIGDWSIQDIKDGGVELSDTNVVLFGGWAEGGSLNKAAISALEKLNLTDKKVVFFMTMGARTTTEHGNVCVQNIEQLASKYDSIGVQVLQGYIAPSLLEKLSKLPDSVLPQSVKIAMKDGAQTYQEPTNEKYQAIATYFKSKIQLHL